MESWLMQMLGWLALPKFGLSTLFIISFVSATLLPMGSEPAVIGLVKLNPDVFWLAILVATAGNTLGGIVTWWMGYGAERAYENLRRDHVNHKALSVLKRFGPAACLLSWVPVIGDPLCAVAGWLRLPFWPCVLYMCIGKFGRYLVMTAGFLWLFPSAWMS